MKRGGSQITPAKRARRVSFGKGNQGASTIRKAGSALIRPVYVNAGKQPFSKQRRCTLKYASRVSKTLSGGFGTLNFSANGITQPNTSGADTQPLYFDQLMAVYKSYTVLGSKIRVRPLSAANSLAYKLCVVGLDTTSALSDLENAMKQPRASRVLLWDQNVRLFDSVVNSYSHFAVYGQLGPLGGAEMSGSISANPTEPQTFQVVIEAEGGTTEVTTFLVEIEYDVLFNDLVSVANSS